MEEYTETIPEPRIARRKAVRRKFGFAGARVERIIRDAGAFRVSSDAIKRLNEIITDRGMDIARYAVEIARHSGRKTVQESDIKLATLKK
ncbi:MAG: histone family protein [Promethearchaeota archaeon]